MASIRNRRTDEEALLDAARDCILGVGLRRTRLTDVAHRAGVSRMTIYRRWPDMESLVADLMTREWTAVARASMEQPTAGSARERLAAGLARGARALREHPVFRRIVELDPQILLPYLIDRRGSSVDWMVDTIAAAIAEGQRDGSVRAGGPPLLARAVVLAAQGFALSARVMADEVSTDALDAELRTMLDRFLAPGPVPASVSGRGATT